MKTTFFILAALLLGAAHVSAQETTHDARTIDTSVNLLIAGGGSTEDNDGIEGLQGGGHDPRRKGFTLQQAELALSGIIDPYFLGETHIIFLEDDVELEEAFFKTTGLPAGLDIKAGLYLTEFGRLNATHPHTWPWIDKPVISGRLLGSDGTRGTGARLAWLTPTPWYSKFIVGFQNADNESMTSYMGEAVHHHGDEEHGGEVHGDEHEDPPFEETIGGLPVLNEDSDDLLASLRWENVLTRSETIEGVLGFSGMVGPNKAGTSSQSTIYGTDLYLKWKPAQNQRGYPFISWQTEVMKRDYESDASSFETADELFAFAGETLEDWGLYSQILWGFKAQWELGIRVDYATGDGEGLDHREEDNLRDDRLRLSPLVQYRASEFSRVRVQYNYDEADHLEHGDAHTVWVGLDFLFGKHSAHESYEAHSGHEHHEGEHDH